jgi:hypothetical protein
LNDSEGGGIQSIETCSIIILNCYEVLAFSTPGCRYSQHPKKASIFDGEEKTGPLKKQGAGSKKGQVQGISL